MIHACRSCAMGTGENFTGILGRTRYMEFKWGARGNYSDGRFIIESQPGLAPIAIHLLESASAPNSLTMLVIRHS